MEEGRITVVFDRDYLLHGRCGGWGCLRCGGVGAVRIPRRPVARLTPAEPREGHRDVAK